MRSRETHRGWRYPRVTIGAMITWFVTVLLAPVSGNGWTAVVNGLAVLALVVVVGVNVWCWFKDRRMAR